MSWRDVPGYEGRYQVSDDGQVRSLPRDITLMTRWGQPTVRKQPGKSLKLCAHSNGYVQVNLYAEDGGRMHYVHRLVALAFVAGDTALEVDHINGKRADNRAANLRWVRHLENQNNRHAPPTAKAGYVGIAYDERRPNPWTARANYAGKQKTVGCYPTLAQAIQARADYLKGVRGV